MGSSATTPASAGSTIGAAILCPPLLPVLAVASCYSAVSTTGSADPQVVAEIKQATDKVVEKWRERKFDIEHVEIWTRAAQGSSAEVAKAAIGGVCHTFILIDAGPSTYLLERLVEGVRFVMLNEEAEQANKYRARRMYLSDNRVISSQDIASWVAEKQTSEYTLAGNNCIHFAYQFGVHFNFTGRLFQSGVAHFFLRARNEVQNT